MLDQSKTKNEVTEDKIETLTESTLDRSETKKFDKRGLDKSYYNKCFSLVHSFNIFDIYRFQLKMLKILKTSTSMMGKKLQCMLMEFPI